MTSYARLMVGQRQTKAPNYTEDDYAATLFEPEGEVMIDTTDGLMMEERIVEALNEASGRGWEVVTETQGNDSFRDAIGRTIASTWKIFTLRKV